MTSFAPATVATFGSNEPNVPLVILLHGRGSNESEIIALAKHLPQEAAYLAVRAPIGEGGGFAWFANRGIGRPVTESLTETMDWFATWFDGFVTHNRKVLLVGFSGGAAFAGGLILDRPEKYSGAAILYGTLPFEAGVAVVPNRLLNTPILIAQGSNDHVIPRELLDRTAQYIEEESGATVTRSFGAGGHGITEEAVADLQKWILDFC